MINPNSRFAHRSYDDYAYQQQAAILKAVVEVEAALQVLGEGRAKALALTHLEECYMWAGKAIRDQQLAREAAMSEGKV